MASPNALMLEWMTAAIEDRYSMVAITGLTFYEWALSAGLEVEFVHKAPWNSAKIMYLLCRYSPLVLWPAMTWSFTGNRSPGTCPPVVGSLQLLQVPSRTFAQVVMVMRAYAFTGRNRKILFVLSMGVMAVVAVDFWVFSQPTYLPPKSFYERAGLMGCFPSYNAGMTSNNVVFTMIAAALLDGVCFAFILVHCYRKRTLEVPLGKYFVLQGFYAFIIVLVVNVSAASTYFSQSPVHAGIAVPLYLVLPNLIACRLVLQLRSQVHPTDSTISRRNSALVHDALATTGTSSYSSSPSDPWLLAEQSEPATPV